MLNAGHPGFVHAPVTKTVIGLVVLSTVFGSIIGSQTRLTLRLPEVTSNLQIWRLLTHNFVFTTPGELLFGVFLLYFFRQFERQMGSSRYAAFALITSSVHTALLCLAQLLVPTLIPASGPYALVFSALVHFFFETPKTYHFQLLGALELSDKSFAYLLAIQLTCSDPPRSLLSFAAALAAGLAYRLPGIREHADFPESVVSTCSTYLLPLLATNQRSNSRSRRQYERMRAAGGLTRERENRAAVSEGNVETLVAMGFSQEQSVAALQRNHDDVHRATEQLLAASG